MWETSLDEEGAVGGMSARLQRAAERMANDSFADHVDELVKLADGDLEAIHDAMQGVQGNAKTAGTPEHIAFTLLAASWKRVADGRRTPERKIS